MKSKLFSIFFIIGIGCFSLILANEYANPQVLERIASYGKNQLGWPSLHYAVKMHDKLAVQTLLESGVSVNYRTKVTYHRHSSDSNEYSINPGYTPIEIAIEEKNSSLASILLDYGADPYQIRNVKFDIKNNEPTGSFSSIFVAIQHKDYETIKTLVAHKVDFNKCCRSEQDKQPLSGYDAAFDTGDTKLISIVLGLE